MNIYNKVNIPTVHRNLEACNPQHRSHQMIQMIALEDPAGSHCSLMAKWLRQHNCGTRLEHRTPNR
jgi:hypothetical protein